MNRSDDIRWNEVVSWCNSVLGASDFITDNSKTHGGHESATYRIRAPDGYFYLKIHQSREHWNNEIHAYEHWTHVFDAFSPRLIEARESVPLALIISEVPGRIVSDSVLPNDVELRVWHSAGAALAALHNLQWGDGFGPCLRDGSFAGDREVNAREYVSRRFGKQIERAKHGGYIDSDELSTIQAAYELIPAFEGERPIPCHRDYCAANWLATESGSLCGVIDFEFAHWDVRVADFSRDPDWNWFLRPDLVNAFFDGYGRTLSPREEQQLLVARAEYALSAIIWGHENSFFGFEREGRESLARLWSRPASPS